MGLAAGPGGQGSRSHAAPVDDPPSRRPSPVGPPTSDAPRSDRDRARRRAGPRRGGDRAGLPALDRPCCGAGAGIDVVVIVAADCCRDDTAARARATPMARSRVVVVEGTWRGPGAARAAAVTAGLTAGGCDAATTWIASTDADCVVAEDWLVAQLRQAAAGCDAVAGIVRLDPAAPPRLRAEFAAAYADLGQRRTATCTPPTSACGPAPTCPSGGGRRTQWSARTTTCGVDWMPPATRWRTPSTSSSPPRRAPTVA